MMQKNFGFFEIYGVSARTRGGGGTASGHFVDKGETGESQFFACGYPLWTGP